ncbi:MAG: flagellar FliJ family protein [Archangiaceae bacterium]|nr:flagellar FliJ family protein [Archangiaceae bacterium]
MDSSTRLDTVKWWRGKQEQDARKAFSEAQRKEEAAREAERKLREALAQEKRATGHAALWELSDLSRSAGEKRLKAAAEVTVKAAAVTATRQAVHLKAHQALKAVEKVVEGIIEEARVEEGRKERRDTDEFAVMRFAR